MKRKLLMAIFFVTAVIAALGITVADAQGPAGGKRAPSANMGTAFTYQGQLKNGGVAVNNTCDFQFGLWDAATLGSQVGVTQTATASVANGLFTTQIDFGANAFNGDARYLATSVRCPTGGGVYTPMTSRQALTPSPLALALPGFYTQQNATSPNLIGGYSGNNVTPNVVGATISGGGENLDANKVTDDYGTVGGGMLNQAGDGVGATNDARFATVGGGTGNTASGFRSTVGGGFANFSIGEGTTVGGGIGNFAWGAFSVINGGDSNNASGDHATIGGGSSNNASGAGSFVGGGGYNGSTNSGNQAKGIASTIGGGYGNVITTTADYATVGGGGNNVITTTADYATIPGGYGALATHYGEMAYASGNFSTQGDAQTSLYVLRRTTTDASSTELLLDGSTQHLTVANGRTVVFDILVVGRTSVGGTAGYRIEGIARNVSGTISILYYTVTTLFEDVASWGVVMDVDNTTNHALLVKVNGSAGTTIRWLATVRTAEVAW